MYWQVNKGWPTLLWDLYNEDGDQAGSYFGAKKANTPSTPSTPWTTAR